MHKKLISPLFIKNTAISDKHIILIEINTMCKRCSILKGLMNMRTKTTDVSTFNYCLIRPVKSGDWGASVLFFSY